MGNRTGLGLHLIFISILLLATAYTCLGIGNMSVICLDHERFALLKFKHSVKDYSGMLSSWVAVTVADGEESSVTLSLEMSKAFISEEVTINANYIVMI